MICPVCGTQIPDDSTFCENCGSRLEPYGGGAPMQPPGYGQQPGYRQPPGYGQQPGYGQPPGGKKNGAGLIILAAAGCLAAAAIVFGTFFFMKNRKEPDGDTAKAVGQETRKRREKEKAETKETFGTMAAEKKTDPTEESGMVAEEFIFQDTDGKDVQEVLPPETEHVTEPTAVLPPVNKPPAGGTSATLHDFDWYEREGFPIDGRPMEELEELGGNWKCRISATSMVNGIIQRRYVVGDAEVQYMGYQVTLVVHVKERYELPVEHPEEIRKLETAEGVNMVLKGDWNPELDGMEIESANSSLTMRIYDYVEAGPGQYAWGTLGDGDTDIGEVVMFRP